MGLKFTNGYCVVCHARCRVDIAYNVWVNLLMEMAYDYDKWYDDIPNPAWDIPFEAVATYKLRCNSLNIRYQTILVELL